jgi:uncharacterized protein YcaQ
MLISLDDLRRFASAYSFFTPTTLKRALHRMGFVQADPIRAPARAQDLILRHRVKDYRAGDLERRYAKLGVEEDFFVIYGFVTKSIQALMHPRSDTCVPAESRSPWPAARVKLAQLLLDFIRERGAGLLRVVRRENGIRIYSAHQHGPAPSDAGACRARLDHLVDVAVRIYAPLPGASLSNFVRRLRFAAPQWRGELKSALQRAKERLSHARVDGLDWYWPAEEDAAHCAPQDMVRLLAPFDPVVRDRDRFELLWGWVYRFEAYTPPPKRKLGYYALPLLWRDSVIGWGNLSVKIGELKSEFGYVDSHPPLDRAFKRELEAELDRMRAFLGLTP